MLTGANVDNAVFLKSILGYCVAKIRLFICLSLVVSIAGSLLHDSYDNAILIIMFVSLLPSSSAYPWVTVSQLICRLY